MYLNGTLKKYGVTVLGTSVEAIMATEDRELFVTKLKEIQVKTPVSEAVESMDDAIKAANQIGFPIMVRSAYALGGLGSGITNTIEEFKTLCESSFAYSKQILVEESLKGWKEIEFEIIRDKNDHCFTVVPMENVDPLGVHTGESIVVAPICTLSKEQITLLEDVANAGGGYYVGANNASAGIETMFSKIEKLDKKASFVNVVDVFSAFVNWLEIQHGVPESGVTLDFIKKVNSLQNNYTLSLVPTA